MRRRKNMIIPAAVLALLIGTSGWLLAGYNAQTDALLAMEQGAENGRVTAFVPEDVQAGLIFYPGGLVDHAAYASLMEELRNRGILCLLIRMPLDLAVLDADAAEGITAAYPEASRWLIGGHSLGGAMAADYAAKHPEEYEGLVLLGAYSAADLRDTKLKVLSVYGSEDGVLNREKYERSLGNYPAEFTERVIAGGNHAQFGSYGQQKGDGEAQISAEEQKMQTADAIMQLLGI